MAFVAGSGFSGGKIASKKAICRGEVIEILLKRVRESGSVCLVLIGG